jgi:hypothetical protein
MDLEDIDKLARVRTIEDIEALPPDTEHVFTYHLDDAKIKSLSRLKQLKVLFNDGNSFVTDAGLKELAGFQSLKELDLEWSDCITDSGLGYLESLTQLQWLDIGFCHGTTRQGMKRLKKALPDCEIIAERFFLETDYP